MVLGQACRLRGQGAATALLPALASAPLTSQHGLWTKHSCFTTGDNFVINHSAASSIYTEKIQLVFQIIENLF